MWQSLGFGPNYKSAYCQAVCPAGDDVIGPYMADRAAWRRDVVVPLLRKVEPVYVRSGTRAEHVALRNASKRVRYIDFDPSTSSPDNLVLGLKHRFDGGRASAAGTRAAVTFVFPGGSRVDVVVADGKLSVNVGGTANGIPPDATVTLCGDDYVRLLHAGSTLASSEGSMTYELAGDSAAVGARLAVLT